MIGDAPDPRRDHPAARRERLDHDVGRALVMARQDQRIASGDPARHLVVRQATGHQDAPAEPLRRRPAGLLVRAAPDQREVDVGVRGGDALERGDRVERALVAEQVADVEQQPALRRAAQGGAGLAPVAGVEHAAIDAVHDDIDAVARDAERAWTPRPAALLTATTRVARWRPHSSEGLTAGCRRARRRPSRAP